MLLLMFYLQHIYYLAFVKFDYGYNMKVNIAVGKFILTDWVMFCIILALNFWIKGDVYSLFNKIWIPLANFFQVDIVIYLIFIIIIISISFLKTCQLLVDIFYYTIIIFKNFTSFIITGIHFVNGLFPPVQVLWNSWVVFVLKISVQILWTLLYLFRFCEPYFICSGFVNLTLSVQVLWTLLYLFRFCEPYFICSGSTNI